MNFPQITLFYLLLTQFGYSQAVAYDWTVSDDAAEWGTSFNSHTSGGTYDRSYYLSSSNTQGSGSLGTNEGPYDGRAGILWSLNTRGITTRSDPNAAGINTRFDLSTVGSSVRIRAVSGFFPLSFASSYTNSYRSQNIMFGLSENANYFGSGQDRSLYVAMDTKTFDDVTKDGIADLRLYNHLGTDPSPTNSTFDSLPTHTLKTDISMSSMRQASVSNPGSMFLYELYYENLGNGELYLGVGVKELLTTSRTSAGVVTSANLIYNDSVVLTHKFDSLADLRPIMGASTFAPNAATSGAGYDWEPEYDQFANFTVPEPSTVGLFMLGGITLMLRRRR